MQALDWVIVALYVAFALWVGARFAKKAGQGVDEFFLSGRSLPWWIAGTSMIATTFAADTPLVITRWVREDGISMNWVWWCMAINTVLAAIFFARYWRRAEVLTTAELSELRYGGRGAKVLRGFLGFLHSVVTNALVLSWVLVAAKKIMAVVLGIHQEWLAIVIACALALGYSLLSGFWGVVITDFLQFFIAMVGAVALAIYAWGEVGGLEAVTATLSADGRLEEVLSLLPHPGEGGFFDPSFWTAPVVGLAVYLGVQWWAKDGVDGGGYVVQRVSACRNEREGVFASLWYAVGTFALRPWPWILVALASLVVLPTLEETSPVAGLVQAAEDGRVEILADGAPPGADPVLVTWDAQADWHAEVTVKADAKQPRRVAAGEVIARTDSERAYAVMMTRYLPVGLLGLMVASILAAFMSTIDTHVNLAASYFVGDVYRRFIAPEKSARHYVLVARLASVGVMLLGGLLAWLADSISDLFLFFLAFLSGVGPVYVLRWFWWKVRASTEIAAMLASSLLSSYLTLSERTWSLGAFSDAGQLTAQGRLCLTVAGSIAVALLSMLFTRAPDPASLVKFYERVRPIGFWGPVRALAPNAGKPDSVWPQVTGFVGALIVTYGALFGVGLWLLDRGPAALTAGVVTALGLLLVFIGVSRMRLGDGALPSR